MKKQRTHLMLALSQQGFGEAILGLRLASSLQSAGDKVFFLAHDSNALLFSDVPHLTIGSHLSKLLPLYLGECLGNVQASSIILSDYLTATVFFDQHGLTPEMLLSFGVPIFAIDTWDSTRHDSVDVFMGSTQEVARWSIDVNSISPAPFLKPQATSTVYHSIPERLLLSRGQRQRQRAALGISENAKTIFFCTAQWQHAHYESDAANRLAVSLPVLIASYISRLGKEVHFVHVGPTQFDLGQVMDGRYHWIPPLAPQDFNNLVASVDLVLSANISATTIARAMAHGIPVMVLRNSISARTREQAEAAMPQTPSSQLRAWLDASVPLFPFALWPLGYHRFLAPLLSNNPYLNALKFLEFLDEQQVEAGLSTLLFDTTAREEHAHLQAAYLSQVNALPSGAELINSHMAK
jgi:Family of unknown function (DUF6365)